MQLSMMSDTVNAAIFALRSTDALPRKIRRAASKFSTRASDLMSDY
jgi:hypothetical protein